MPNNFIFQATPWHSQDHQQKQVKMADIDTFMDTYKSMNDEIKPRFETLKNLDLFVLDNSIRESTVGALRGHTLQNKIDILEQVTYGIFF